MYTVVCKPWNLNSRSFDARGTSLVLTHCLIQMPNDFKLKLKQSRPMDKQVYYWMYGRDCN